MIIAILFKSGRVVRFTATDEVNLVQSITSSAIDSVNSFVNIPSVPMTINVSQIEFIGPEVFVGD